jgi:DNA-binding response OmpR family regulator
MGYHVLLVDDEESFSLPAANLLRKEGFEVETALNGREAEEKSARSPSDLVVLDLCLPGAVDGLDVLHSIRREQPDISCVLVTAYGNNETKKRARDLGVQAYLEKPFELDVLVEIIRLLANQHNTNNRHANQYHPDRFAESQKNALVSIMEQLPIGVVLANEDSQVLYSNQVGAEAIAAQTEEIQGRDNYLILPDPLKSIAQQAYGKPTDVPFEQIVTSKHKPSMNYKVSTLCPAIQDWYPGATVVLVFQPYDHADDLLQCPTAQPWLRLLLQLSAGKNGS